MEKEKDQAKTKGKNGGVRPGAGRPKGSKSHITIECLFAC